MYERNKISEDLKELGNKTFEDKNRSISLANEALYIQKGANLIPSTLFKQITFDKQLKKHIILFIFSDLDCGNCLTQEVLKLNNLHQQKLIQILGLYSQKGQNTLEEVIDRYAIDFPTQIFDIHENTFVKSVIMKTPVIFYYDLTKNRIVDAYQPIPNDLIFRDYFYNRIINLIKAFDI